MQIKWSLLHILLLILTMAIIGVWHLHGFPFTPLTAFISTTVFPNGC